MKTLDKIIKETNSCPNDDKIYLVESISTTSGLFCSNGDLLYLVFNSEGCKPMSVLTEYLQMDTGVFVHSFNANNTFPDAEYNILRYKKTGIDNHYDNVESFVNLCVAHSTMMHGDSFEQFFYSLISLFQLPKEQSYLNLEGLFGELSVIKHLFLSYKVDISNYWHVDGPYSKYDFSLPNKNYLEVKSSVKGDKAINIKHSQLFSSSDRIVLASVHLLEDHFGITLDDLIKDIRSNNEYCNSLKFEIALQKELKRVSPDEALSKKFSIKSIHYFLNLVINPFTSIPQNVDKLEYSINLSDSLQMDINSLDSFIN